MAIISGASTAMQISQTNKATQRQQEAAVAQQNLMNQQRAQEMEEIKAEAGMEATQEARERLAERASIKAAQAESGVAGVSPLRELANVYMQEAINTGTIISKQEAELRTSGMQAQRDYLSTVSAINQAESQKTTGLAAALQIGVAGAQGYAMSGGTFGGTSGIGAEVGNQASIYSGSKYGTNLMSQQSKMLASQEAGLFL